MGQFSVTVLAVSRSNLIGNQHLGGHSRPRCEALSKRSKQQCGKAAPAGKRACIFHGGQPTDAVISGGIKRCLAAKNV